MHLGNVTVKWGMKKKMECVKKNVIRVFGMDILVHSVRRESMEENSSKIV